MTIVNAFRRALPLAAALALCSALPAAQAQTPDPARGAFRLAWATATASPPPAGDPPLLREYVLYPYLQARRFNKALEAAAVSEGTDDAIDRFLQEQGAAPAARSLRSNWFRSLAARQRWNVLERHAGAPPPDERGQCLALQARIRTGGRDAPPALAEDALALWLSGKNRDDACDPVFDWLKSGQLLTAERIVQRIGLALEAGNASLARYLARSLPEAAARPHVNAALMLENPSATLPRLLDNPDAPIEDRWLIAGFDKLARRNAPFAQQHLERAIERRALSAATAGALRRGAALGLAYDREPAALPAFARVPAAALDAVALEWWVRTALWQGDWQSVRAALALMQEPQRSEPRWRYWQARTLEKLGTRDEALAAYTVLATERDFYGFVAAERAGLAPAMAARATVPDPVVQARLLGTPSLQRARELFALDMPGPAVLEWRDTVAPLDKPAKAQAAVIAGQWGWYEQAIGTLAESGEWDDVLLRYPLPYRELVAESARRAALPEHWVYAVMRAESLYNPNAVSRADAYGLLQLLLPTAQRTARRSGLREPAKSDLFVPADNIELGSRYLAELQQQLGGSFLFTIAAYNAGPGRIPQWQPPAPMDADVWIENIPFNETREYVRRVLFNTVVFAWRLTGKAGSLAPLMQTVPAKAAAAAQAVAPAAPATTAATATEPAPPADAAVSADPAMAADPAPPIDPAGAIDPASAVEAPAAEPAPPP